MGTFNFTFINYKCTTFSDIPFLHYALRFVSAVVWPTHFDLSSFRLNWTACYKWYP